MRTVLLLVLVAPHILAVNYVTIRSGNWNNINAGETPWATGTCTAPVEVTDVIPTGGLGGDRVTICNGHTLTNPNGFSASAGDSDTPGTLGLAADGTGGTGILVNNGLLTVRANVRQAASPWTSGPGSSIVFDNTTALTWQIAGAASQANAKLLLNGVAGSRVSVSSTAGGAAGRFTAGGLTCGGRIEAYNTDFNKVGDATNALVRWFPATGCSAGSRGFIWEGVTLNNTGLVDNQLGMPTDAVWRIKRVKCTNTAASQCFNQLASTAIGTGERLYEDVSLDKRFGNGATVRDFTFRNIYFGDGWSVATTQQWAEFRNIFMVSDDNVVDQASGSIIDSYVLIDLDGGVTPIINAKPISFTGTTAMTYEVRGNVMEASSGTADPDGFVMSANPSSGTSSVVMEGNINIKEGIGNDATASCFTLNTNNANATLIYRNNTCYVGQFGAIFEIPGGPGMAGGVSSFTRNIFWDDQAARGYKFKSFNTAGNTTTDIVAPANANWNNGWQTKATDARNFTNEANGYISHWSVAPGVNDLAIDPKFVDTTRRITAYDAMLGGAGTYISARARLQGVWDGSFRVADLVNWVKQGYAPRNLELVNLSAGGVGYIGAVKPVLIFGVFNTGN